MATMKQKIITTKKFNSIIEWAEDRNDLKNRLSIVDEKLKQAFDEIDESVIKGSAMIESIKFDLEFDETEKTEAIAYKTEFEKYVKSKKEDFNAIVKKLTEKCKTWQKRNYRIVRKDATNKGCRHVLHSQSVIGKLIKK